MLESGHKFMPNVSTRKLTKAIEGERNPTAKFRLLGVPLQKEWLQHQEDLQGNWAQRTPPCAIGWSG